MFFVSLIPNEWVYCNVGNNEQCSTHTHTHTRSIHTVVQYNNSGNSSSGGGIRINYHQDDAITLREISIYVQEPELSSSSTVHITEPNPMSMDWNKILCDSHCIL